MSVTYPLTSDKDLRVFIQPDGQIFVGHGKYGHNYSWNETITFLIADSHDLGAFLQAPVTMTEKFASQVSMQFVKRGSNLTEAI